MSPIGLAASRHLLRHPWVVVLAVLGIALGVAMATAIDLAIASSRRAFTESVAGVAGRATHEIVAGPSGIADLEFGRVRRELAPWPVAPLLESDVALTGHPGRVLRLMGVDPLCEGPFRPYVGAIGGVAGGKAGDRADDQDGLRAAARLMTTPDAVALASATAASLGIGLGGRLDLRIGTRVRTVEVVALLDSPDEFSRRAIADLAICDIATAQELLGRVGRIDRLSLIAPAGSEARLSALAMPAGAELRPAAARASALDQMTRAFHLNLTALSLLALVVGMFLIHNTVGFLVVQRRELIGRLRLAGATRCSIAVTILCEAAVFGVVGTALGLALGIAAAHELVNQVTRTISDLYFVVAVQEVALPPATLAKDAGLGLCATLLAAALPVWEATTTRPSAVAARSTIEARARRTAPWLAMAGIALLAAAWALIAIGGSSLALGFMALALVIVGYALLIPLSLGAIIALIARPLAALGGPVAAMAARSVSATLSRTGVAVAALVIASAASLGVGIMVGSFRSSLQEWLDATLRADVYISAPRAVAARINEVTLPAELVERLARVDGVAALVTKRDAHPTMRAAQSAMREAHPMMPGATGDMIDLVAFQMPSSLHAGFTFVVGDPALAWPAFAAGDVLVTEPFAFRHAVGPGASLRILTDHGERAFTVAGVVKDYSNDQGSVFIDRAAYERCWNDRGISGVSVIAVPGVEVDALIARLRAAAGDADLWMSSNRALRRESLAVFDQTFAITGIIRVLAGAVAFLGILGALLALALERAREIAVMRMHGCTPGQVMAITGGQAAITGIAAGVMSLPLGIALAAVLALVINRRSFGWSFALHVDPWLLVQALLLAVAAAVLASVYPAWRLSRVAPAAALRDE